MYRNILAILVVAVLTSSCLANKGQQGAVGGAAGGALLGQLIGRNTKSTLIGAAVGGMLGYIVGNEMDKYDRDQLNKTYESSPSNEKTSWVNPDTGKEYAVTPQPAYQDPTYDRVCRKAEIEAVIDGKKEITEATACRENGRWVIQQ
jgi:surface antigen